MFNMFVVVQMMKASATRKKHAKALAALPTPKSSSPLTKKISAFYREAPKTNS